MFELQKTPLYRPKLNTRVYTSSELPGQMLLNFRSCTSQLTTCYTLLICISTSNYYFRPKDVLSASLKQFGSVLQFTAHFDKNDKQQTNSSLYFREHIPYPLLLLTTAGMFPWCYKLLINFSALFFQPLNPTHKPKHLLGVDIKSETEFLLV